MAELEYCSAAVKYLTYLAFLSISSVLSLKYICLSSIFEPLAIYTSQIFPRSRLSVSLPKCYRCGGAYEEYVTLDVVVCLIRVLDMFRTCSTTFSRFLASDVQLLLLVISIKPQLGGRKERGIRNPGPDSYQLYAVNSLPTTPAWS